MKTATKVIFTSALMLSVVAPTLSNAASHKVTRHKGAAQTQVSREGIREFYGTDNTSVPLSIRSEY